MNYIKKTMSEDYFIPKSLMEKIIAQYRGGVTLIELSREYNMPYDILKNRLKVKKINVHDFKSENLGKIIDIEKKLVVGTFPNYKINMDIETEEDYRKYKSLLFYYSTSCLNSGHVHSSQRLTA